MDTTNTTMTAVKELPLWAKILLGISAALAASVTAIFSLSSCGTTTRVHARATDTASVTLSISTPSNTNVSTDVKPDIDIKISPNNNK